MADYQSSIIIKQPRDVVFEAVTDVESYPSFLSFWADAKKQAFEENKWTVAHKIGFEEHNFEFNVSGELQPPERVVMRSTDAPFKRFDAEFLLEALDADTTKLTFKADYELTSEKFENLANLAADKLYDHAVSAFRRRAHEIGGKRG
jgi:ribosome-associated toxin RatA of RatAB toxin-antitoxin module